MVNKGKHASAITRLGSSVIIGSNAIRINTDENRINPLGVVTIMPKVQLELGMEIKQFIECLRMTRIPLMLQRATRNRKSEQWQIIRIPTGNVPEAIVCTLNITEGIIDKVSFNQDLLYNKEYRKYQRLSAIHQLTAGKVDDSGNLSRAVSAVSTLTGINPDRFKIKASHRTIVVYSNTKGEKRKYRYTFIKDSRNSFNLLSIGFV